MRYRKLRIAWSVMCGIACVLLISLWVRSYVISDTASVPLSSSWSFEAKSHFGWMKLSIEKNSWPAEFDAKNVVRESWSSPLVRTFGQKSALQVIVDPNLYGMEIPYCLLLIVAAFCVALPWIRWSNRFSLRTLLIATTLVAVVLGTIAWLR